VYGGPGWDNIYGDLGDDSLDDSEWSGSGFFYDYFYGGAGDDTINSYSYEDGTYAPDYVDGMDQDYRDSCTADTEDDVVNCENVSRY
jgi:hypothetical protein